MKSGSRSDDTCMESDYSSSLFLQKTKQNQAQQRVSTEAGAAVAEASEAEDKSRPSNERQHQQQQQQQKQPFVRLCRYAKCRLKAIAGFDSCYQHIDLTNGVRKPCRWRTPTTTTTTTTTTATTSSKCNQAACSVDGLCLTHAALKRRALGKTQNNNNNNTSSKFKLVASPSSNETDRESEEGSKAELSEQRFLRNDTAAGAARKQRRRTHLRQQVAARHIGHQADAKRTKRAVDGHDDDLGDKAAGGESTDSSDEDDDDEMNDDDDDDYFALASVSELENDLELLDSSDSLDRSVRDLIKAKLASSSSNSNSNSNSKTARSDASNRVDYDVALSHAGVLTHQEAVRIYQTKLSKLHLLYKKQLSIVNDRVVYERKRYLAKRCQQEEEEKETTTHNMPTTSTAGNNNTNNSDNRRRRPGQHHHHSKLLKACQNYPTGQSSSTRRADRYLLDKYHPARYASPLSALVVNDETTAAATTVEKMDAIVASCFFSSECKQPTLPHSKYCLEHIMSDKGQVLFDVCGIDAGCRKPVVKSLRPHCRFHACHADGLLTGDELAQLRSVSSGDHAAALRLRLTPRQPPHLAELGALYKRKDRLAELARVSATAATAAAAQPSQHASSSQEENSRVNERVESDDAATVAISSSSLVCIKQELVDNDDRIQSTAAAAAAACEGANQTEMMDEEEEEEAGALLLSADKQAVDIASSSAVTSTSSTSSLSSTSSSPSSSTSSSTSSVSSSPSSSSTSADEDDDDDDDGGDGSSSSSSLSTSLSSAESDSDESVVNSQQQQQQQHVEEDADTEDYDDDDDDDDDKKEEVAKPASPTPSERKAKQAVDQSDSNSPH